MKFEKLLAKKKKEPKAVEDKEKEEFIHRTVKQLERTLINEISPEMVEVEESINNNLHECTNLNYLKKSHKTTSKSSLNMKIFKICMIYE
jgi:hypothetical protein